MLADSPQRPGTDEPTPEALSFVAVYLLLGLLGIAYFGALEGVMELNAADNALHLLLATVLLGVGVIFGGVE